MPNKSATRTPRRSVVVRRRTHICAVLATTLAATLLAAPAQSAFTTLGPGRDPSIAVDAAGTAYVAWSEQVGDEPKARLRFCRFPRGATACDVGPPATIPPVGDSLFGTHVFVSGDRVAVLRAEYPGVALTGARGMRAYTSTDRGTTFGPGKIVGSLRGFPRDAVAGPADTVYVVANASGEAAFQSMPVDGSAPLNPDGSSAVPYAPLAAAPTYHPSVGLLDAATPLVVYERGTGTAGNAAVRRYDGSGPLFLESNWTPAVEIGPLHYPSLAGGPKGMFLLSRTGGLFAPGNMTVRKYDGTTFAAPVTLGPSGGTGYDLVQDAGGRLHALYDSGDVATAITLVHAVSDNGVTWSQGNVASYPPNIGAIVSVQAGVAPDHRGFVIADFAIEGGAVSIAPIGPDAPGGTVPPPIPPPATVTPPPPPPVVPRPAVKPKPKFTASASAKRLRTRVRIRIKGELVPPPGIADAKACKGAVVVSFKRGNAVVIARTVAVNKGCEFGFSALVKKSTVKRATKLALRILFLGNDTLAVASKNGSVKVNR